LTARFGILYLTLKSEIELSRIGGWFPKSRKSIL